MPNFTEAQMRTDLENEIKLAAPLSVVFLWWALGGDENQWPAKLISAADGDRVHGYVISRSRTFAQRLNPGCVRRFFTYQIRGLRFYETGDRTLNSDLTYNAELDAICARFNIKSSLAQSLRRIAEDSELDFSVDLRM